MSTYVGISTKKIVPVPAVPEPNSPEGVIPEYPSRGDFLAGSNLYSFYLFYFSLFYQLYMPSEAVIIITFCPDPVNLRLRVGPCALSEKKELGNKG